MLFILPLLFACQEKEPLTCEYGDQTYTVGDSFSSMDGCNTCSCDEEDGEAMVSCTLMACDTGEYLEEPDCINISIDECEEADQCTVIMASQVIVNEEEECFYRQEIQQHRGVRKIHSQILHDRASRIHRQPFEYKGVDINGIWLLSKCSE